MNARTTNTVRLGLQKLESRESPSTLNIRLQVRDSGPATPATVRSSSAIINNTGVTEGVGGYDSFVSLRSNWNM